MTVSVGMALLRDDDLALELFTRADQAMYAVKRVGGNRVMCEREVSSEFIAS